jgi:hypothetical protein
MILWLYHRLAVCIPRDLMNLEVYIGSLKIQDIHDDDRAAFRSFNTEHRNGSWTFHYDSSTPLEYLKFKIGPFTSEEEFMEFDPNDATTTSQTNNRMGEPFFVDFCDATFQGAAISGLVDDFEQRRQQAHDRIVAALAEPLPDEIDV